MFLRSLNMESITPCLAYPEKIKVIAAASDELNEVIPYLGSTVKKKARKVMYNQNVPVLSFTLDGHRYTVHAKKIAITTLESIEQARQCLDWVQQEINSAYNQKEEITPLTGITKVITPFDLYRYTPQTNCGECGEATCLAFASKLSKDKISLSKCSVLQKRDYCEGKNKITEILEEVGYEIT